MLLIAFLPQPAEARRGAAPWTPVPVSAWLGPLTSAAVPAALRGKPVPGRDGPACWRAVPKSLAAEAAQRPVRLQGLVERAGSGVVLAAAEICLRAPGPVRLAVTSPAALELAVDGHPVTTLTLWSAARYRPISARHITAMKLAAGCHRLVAALRSPSGRLGLRWWVAGRGVSIARPARPARDAQCLRGWAPRPAAAAPQDVTHPNPELDRALASAGTAVDATKASGRKPSVKQARKLAKRQQALATLCAAIERGGARGVRHTQIKAALLAAPTAHRCAAAFHAAAQAESGDRIAALAAAVDRWPTSRPLALALVRALDEAGRSHEALEIWRRRLRGAERSDPVACARRALLWQRLDVTRAARAMAAKCAVRFPTHPAGQDAIARLAAAAEDLVAAARARAALAKMAPDDPERWLDLIGAMAELAEHTPLGAGQQARLVGALAGAPRTAQAWDTARARNALALAWLRRGKPARAERLLRAVPRWARRAFTLELLARAILAHSPTPPRRAEATRLLRTALKRAPSRADLRARLALLAPKRAFYLPYQRDLTRFAKTRAKRGAPSAPFVQLLRQTVVRQLAPGRLARYEVNVWQIGKGGPRSHDVEISYVPTQSTPEVLQAAVVRPDGSVMRGVPQEMESLNEQGDGLYYDLEQITLKFKGLRPGDVLISAHTLRDFAPDPFGLVFGELFQLGDAWPVLETEIVLELDPSATPVSAWRRPAGGSVRPGVLQETGAVITGPRSWRRWRFRPGPLAAVAVESSMPGASDVVDTLHVSTFASWPAAAHWYAKLVADAMPKRGTLTELTRLAKRLTKGLSSEAKKTEALYRWVADEVRYVGLEFGIHSLKPHPVSEVLARRFGDCKDKATLLVALLAEVGIEGRVALVRTADSGKLRDNIASLGGFGHAIAWVPALGWWLDATLQHHQPTELPAGDVGGQALAIPRKKGDKVSLIDLPDGGPKANRRIEHSHVQLAVDGSALLSLSVRAHGLPAAQLRERLHAETSRIERIQSDLAARYPGIRVTNVDVTGVSPAADEVTVAVTATVPRLQKGQADIWSWRPLLPESPWRKQASQQARRTHPYVAEYGWHDARSVVISPAKGWQLMATDSLRQENGGLGRYEVQVSLSKTGAVRFSRTVERSQRVLPAKAHTPLVQWLKRLDVALGQELRVSRARQP